MKKDWTTREIKQLVGLVKEKGKSQAIKDFALESGRSENSVRIKLARLDKNPIKVNEEAVLAAEEAAYKKYVEPKHESQDSFLKRVFKRLFCIN